LPYADRVNPYDTYTSPLASRNASPRMLTLWSARHKFNTWRRIWLAVARAQHEMALPVSMEQVEELRDAVARGITDDELRAAEKYERDLRHDVMAHVHALGDSCPKARGIIHLGMTSQDVVCNADLSILTQAMCLVLSKAERCAVALASSAERCKSIPTLAFTHYQPAQPTTVGRRAAQWAYEISLAANRLRGTLTQLASTRRGLRGATGTQASYLALFDNQGPKVDELEARFVFALQDEGWEVANAFTLQSQTYPRVVDTFILADLASIACILHKIATDIRLLCNRKELDEPFEEKQIGSSAMPYKRNPMRCERICGLSRFVMNLVGNAFDTAATQWLERTLDDSSNRRLSLPEGFLALDGALDLMHNVASGLVVHEAMVRKNLMEELPFMATENILMACVKLGADRQEYHEKIRVHAQAAGWAVKQEGKPNDLLDRLRADPAFHAPAMREELDWEGVLDPMKYVGRSVEQAEQFIRKVIEPLRKEYPDTGDSDDSYGPRV